MIEEVELVAEGLAVDKSTWTKVKFGDVAIQQKENVDRESTVLTRYVAGEHMGSEDLHIRNWGEVNDDYLGPAFHRKFESGDILYGSRRTYLRKVAVAHFEGITANTTFVIKANEGLILKELLPFVMLSEGFAQHSIKNSKGSVNPYVNWKDIASYEFLLPPIDQQEQIAELLWSGDEAIEKESMLHTQLFKFASAFFDNLLFNQDKSSPHKIGNRNSNWAVQELGKYISLLQYGISEPLGEVKVGVPVLRMNNLNNGKLHLDDLKYYNPNKGELENFILNKGDVLFNRTNSFELVGKVSLFDSDGEYSFASYLIRIKTNNKLLDPRFLNYYLNSPVGISTIQKYRTPGVSQSNINAQSIKKFLIPIPPISVQEEAMDKIETILANGETVFENLGYLKSLQRSLINQIF